MSTSTVDQVQPETNGKPADKAALLADPNWNMSSEQEQSRALHLADLYQQNMFEKFVLPAAAAAAATATAIALEKLSSSYNIINSKSKAPITPGNRMPLAGVKKRRKRRRRRRRVAMALNQTEQPQGADRESVHGVPSEEARPGDL